jgi:hypothetical protein
MPITIWKKTLRTGEYNAPKLQISSLSMRFAADISQLNLDFFAQDIPNKISGAVANIEEHKSCSECSNEVPTESELVDNNVEVGHEWIPLSNLSPSEYPMLSSLGVHTEKNLDKVLQEVVKLHGQKSIYYL